MKWSLNLMRNFFDMLKTKLPEKAISLLTAYGNPGTILKENSFGIVEFLIASVLQAAGKPITKDEVDAIAPKVIEIYFKQIAVLQDAQSLFLQIKQAAESEA